MRLKAKVVALESGFKFTDKISRFTLRFLDADSLSFSDIRLKQEFDQTFELNDLVDIEVVGITTADNTFHPVRVVTVPDKF